MVSVDSSDVKKIGLGLTGFGVLSTVIGVLFFFDNGFLVIGNILFLVGVTLNFGMKSTIQFFMKRRNYKVSISFGVGFFFVIIGWPIFGMLAETYGFITLLCGLWPTRAVFLTRIPIVGWIFSQPVLISFFERGRPKRVPI